MTPLLLMAFLDALAMGLTFTILPPLLLKTGNGAFLSDSIPLDFRGVLLGAFITCFTIGQFVCSPVLGYVSAFKGHKSTLRFLFFLSILSYSLGMASLRLKSLPLLFISKFIVGISTSGRPLFQAALTEQITSEKKAKLYGWLGASGGLGFIIGSFMTQLGIQSSPILVRYFSFFTLATIFSFANWILVSYSLKNVPFTLASTSWSLQKGFSELKHLIKSPALSPIFVTILFYFFAWELFYTFVPLYLMKYLEVKAEQTTSFYTVVNFWSFIGNGVIEHWFSNYSNYKVLKWITPLWSGLLFLLGWFQRPLTLWVIIALVSTLGAVLNCTLSALLADQVQTRQQGEALGISQALQCIARLLPSLFLASFLIHRPSLPLLGSALAFLLVAFFSQRKAASYQKLQHL